MTDTLTTADLHAPVVDAAMGAAADMLGMEVVYIGGLSGSEFSLVRVRGTIPGVSEGTAVPRQKSLCHHMLDGADNPTSNAGGVPAYADLPTVSEIGVTSYVGVPIRSSGGVIGTLCGIDRSRVDVTEEVQDVLAGLASIIEAHLADTDTTVVRRSGSGWRVGVTDELDLTSAMSLADLLAAETETSPRPPRAGVEEMTETDRLRLSVVQLEHALAARVTVEQAIGVIAERQRLTPRTAFERLRKAARTRGRKVHDVAREVVGSAVDPTVPLPPELAPRR